MNVIILWFFEQFTVWAPAMDHAASHGDGDTKDVVKKRGLTSCNSRFGMPHSIDASLREGQVDGFGKVQRCCRRISEV